MEKSARPVTDFPERDDQREAEVLDETHLTADGVDIANFDDIPDGLDVTQAAGDGDESPVEDWAAEWSDGETDVPEPDGDVSPLTRLEDRAETGEAPIPGRLEGSDLVIDDASARPAGLEAGD